MEEISILQVNFLFSQQGNRAEQFARAKKRKNRYKIITQEAGTQKEKTAVPENQNNNLSSF